MFPLDYLEQICKPYIDTVKEKDEVHLQAKSNEKKGTGDSTHESVLSVIHELSGSVLQKHDAHCTYNVDEKAKAKAPGRFLQPSIKLHFGRHIRQLVFFRNGKVLCAVFEDDEDELYLEQNIVEDTVQAGVNHPDGCQSQVVFAELLCVVAHQIDK